MPYILHLQVHCNRLTNTSQYKHAKYLILYACFCAFIQLNPNKIDTKAHTWHDKQEEIRRSAQHAERGTTSKNCRFIKY